MQPIPITLRSNRAKHKRSGNTPNTKRSPYPERYNRLFDEIDTFTAVGLEIPAVGDVMLVTNPSIDGVWAKGKVTVAHVALIDNKLLVTLNTDNGDRELINHQWTDFLTQREVKVQSRVKRINPHPASKGLPKAGDKYVSRNPDQLNAHLQNNEVDIKSVGFFNGELVVTATLSVDNESWEEMNGQDWFHAIKDLGLVKVGEPVSFLKRLFRR